jgi:CRISPR-associated protein Cas1
MTSWQDWRRAFRSREKRKAACEGPRLEDIANLEALAEAWSRVRANKGGPGADGVTIEALAPVVERELERLSADLLAERYRPAAPRQALIRKPSGGARRLTIPAVVDRIAQTAALIILEPHLDQHMSEASWAYRPGRGVPQAIAAAEAARAAGFAWTVDADIEGYFDAIPHRELKADLTIWLDDERVLRLLAKWLRAFGWRGRGIAQGAPISPLFANLYLHPLDRQFGMEGAVLVRYADDFIILARSAGEARQALRAVARRLRHRGLKLNSAKTRIVPPGEELTFLGRQFTPAGKAPEARPSVSKPPNPSAQVY